MASEAELVELTLRKFATVKQQRSAALAPTRPPGSEAPLFDGLFESAALLGWFEADGLRPTQAVAGDARDRLVASSIIVLDDHGERRLSLRADTRVRVLRQLRQRGTVQRAIRANQGQPGDTLNRLLLRQLTGVGPPLDELSLAELHSTSLVCDWLRSAGFDVQDAELLVRRREWLTFLEPFEHLAGRYFRGRANELATLRAYADVLPPGNSVGPAPVEVRFDPATPFLIFGPGGVGKSTLVARFILEHAQALERDRFPFAYLDFDRPDVDAAEPVTILIEALRQLAIEYPDIDDRATGIREDWLDALRKPNGAIRARLSAAADFGRLLSSIGAIDRPAVLVLDTFEEVQYRSLEYVHQILALLAEVGRFVPRLKVIITGRSTLPGVRTPSMLLTAFDHEAAVGFLQAHGVLDDRHAAQIAAKVGGDPQNLKLAASDYLADRPDRRSSLDDFLGEFDRTLIRQKLHNRVLDHIHDPDVRRLAHPGLVLRRLTAELIVNVLAGPCGLSMTTLTEAERVFGELARETALVEIDTDGSLIHRPELRRSILGLLEKDEPGRSEQIHQGAVSFYARRSPNSIERAEEIYHRLKLDQDREVILDRWLPGVENRLINAVDEFDGARGAFLAAQLDLAVIDQVLHAAALPDWERLVAPRVRALIDNGESAAAMDLSAERDGRTPTSELVELEAEALVTLGRPEDARTILRLAIERADRSELPDDAVRLLRFEAEIMITGQHWSWSSPIVSGLSRLADQTHNPAHELAAAAVARAVFLNSPNHQTDDPGAVRRGLDAVNDAMLVYDPALGALAGLTLRDPADAPRIRRILGLIGQPVYDPSMLRRLAAQIARFDRSQDYGVSRRYGLDQRGSGTETWSEHLIQAPVVEATSTILRLLDDYGTELPGSVITAGADALTSTLAPWHWYPQVGPPATTSSGDEPPPPEPDLSPKAHQELVESLSNIFTRDTLRSFLHLTQALSLDSLAPTGTPLVAAIGIVVDHLAQSGALTKLLASAREVAPSDEGLLDVALEIGLSTLSSAGPTERILGGSSLSAEEWRATLGRIESQVCLITRQGAPFLTGLLMGEDLVLTAGLLPDDYRELDCRFDFQATTGGSTISTGTEFRVRRLLAPEPADQTGLGFALLMVEGSPGVQPVGGSTDTGVIPRGWLDVDWAPNPEIGAALVMAHHADAELLTLTSENHGVIGFSDDQTLIYHRLDAELALAGAPIFDIDLHLVALNVGRRPDGSGVGVLINAVTDHLNESGLGYLFGTTLA